MVPKPAEHAKQTSSTQPLFAAVQYNLIG